MVTKKRSIKKSCFRCVKIQSAPLSRPHKIGSYYDEYYYCYLLLFVGANECIAERKKKILAHETTIEIARDKKKRQQQKSAEQNLVSTMRCADSMPTECIPCAQNALYTAFFHGFRIKCATCSAISY